MFYNICTNEIEDFFNGKEDLKNGILRTPIDPYVSFSEDPLRILRCLRFGSRFGFKYDENIFPAIKSSIEVYLHKVTAERAAVEVQKALEGHDPIRYIREIIDSGFFNNVFDRNNEICLDCEDVFSRVSFVVPKLSDSYRFATILAAIYAPDFGKGWVDSKKYGKKVDHIERDIARILRMQSSYANEAKLLLAVAKNFASIEKIDKLSVGHAIRNSGELWRHGVCLVFDERKYNFIQEKVIPYAMENNLCNVWQMKPLMDGNQLSSLHGVKGVQLKKIMEEMIDWQIENIDSSVDDYILYVNMKSC